MARHIRMWGVGPGLVALTALAGCSDRGFDFDLRDNLSASRFDTSAAADQVVADRPKADNRGIISYPSYQVAVARSGDTVADVASRVGLPAQELSDYNGVPADVPLRRGEIIALPRRVSEPSPATGSPSTGPIRPANTSGPSALQTDEVDVAALAGNAINRSDDSGGQISTPSGPSRNQTQGQGQSQPKPQGQSGEEPIRHRVAAGETAFSIARRYGVPLEALGEWNGLGSNFDVREGQYLLIPPTGRSATPAAQPVTKPGEGTATPTPPSAAEPLPKEDAKPGPAKETPKSPDLGAQATKASDMSRLAMPVKGPIIRDYQKGKNDGIDIQASPGTAVSAADAGTVATITRDTGQVPILVLRHDKNLLTVYAGVEAVNVNRGDKVKRGQTIAKVAEADPSFVHFEVLEGFESVDPSPYLE